MSYLETGRIEEEAQGKVERMKNGEGRTNRKTESAKETGRKEGGDGGRARDEKKRSKRRIEMYMSDNGCGCVITSSSGLNA